LLKFCRSLQILTVGIVIIVIATFIIVSSAEAAVPRDIDQSSSWAKDAISQLAAQNVIRGDENGNFKPHDQLTRAQMATILVNALGLNVTDLPTTATFNDVPIQHWAFPFVETAYKHGLVQGIGSGKFGVNDRCTREQMTCMFIRAIGIARDSIGGPESISSLQKFEDKVMISSWARDDVGFAVRNEILNGNKVGNRSYFDPQGFATREQVAVVTYKFIPTRKDIISVYQVAAHTQIAVDHGQIGFEYFFSKPAKVAGAYILDKDGNEIYKFSHYDHSGDDWSYRYLHSADDFSNLRILQPGATYTLRYATSFIKNGELSTPIIFCTRKVTVPLSEYYIKAVTFANANQLIVSFNAFVDEESAVNLSNYIVSDQYGNRVEVKKAAFSEWIHQTYLTLAHPIANDSVLRVSVNNIKSPQANLLYSSYSANVLAYDNHSPYISSVSSTKDDKSYSTLTFNYSEPVVAGQIYIDQVPVASVSGESTSISGLKLDVNIRHYIAIDNLSDGVNRETATYTLIPDNENTN